MKTFKEKQSKYADDFVKKIKTLNLDNESAAEKLELKVIRKFIENPRNKEILDLGGGTGRIGLKLSKDVKNVIELDISKKSIQIANNTAQKYGIKNFKGIVGSIENAKYRNRFDYVIMVSFMHHLDDPSEVLESVKKVLKPNGKIIIFELNPLNPLFIPFLIYLKAFKSHFNLGYAKSQIHLLKLSLLRNGFDAKTIYKFGFFPTMLVNYFPFIQVVNEKLNKIPILKSFSAFHIIVAEFRK